MATFRVYKESGNFVTVHKNFIHDNKISWKAKGILLYLLSRPDDWQVYENELVKHTSDGLSSLKSGIKELEEIGYIRRTRKRDDKGRLKEYEYSVFEHPTHMRLSNVGKTNVGKSNIGKTNVGESHTTNNNGTKNDLTNNDSNKNNSSSKPQSPFDFYQSNGFGVLKPYISEQIGAWIDDFKENGNEIVIEAMKESLNNNVFKWNYVNSILKSWFNDGIRSVDDISARNNKRIKQEEIADEDNPYLKSRENKQVGISDEVNKRRQKEMFGVSYEEFI